MVWVFVRRVGESLVIGDEIIVTALSVRNAEARFAIANRPAQAQVKVFTVRIGENLVIDEEIDIAVLSIRDDEVRIEVVTPKSVSI